jgi:DNA-binding response OmpR family regulator
MLTGLEQKLQRPCTVLLIESDVDLAEALTSHFLIDGYQVLRAPHGMAGMSLARDKRPDIIILDADLPGIDGITLCGMVRKQSSVPIIMLTDGSDELQLIVGLDTGADLCLVKPISLAELRARIRSLLRRVKKPQSPRPQALAVGDLQLDVQRRRAWRCAKELQLTPKEFDLLAYLMRNHGMVMSRDQLLREVWGERVAPNSQTLEVHIRWLRQKIETDPNRPAYIQTVRMVGYRLDGP